MTDGSFLIETYSGTDHRKIKLQRNPGFSVIEGVVFFLSQTQKILEAKNFVGIGTWPADEGDADGVGDGEGIIGIRTPSAPAQHHQMTVGYGILEKKITDFRDKGKYKPGFV